MSQSRFCDAIQLIHAIENDEKVYLLENGYAKWIATYAEFQKLKLSMKDVKTVKGSDIANYAMGIVIGTPEVEDKHTQLASTLTQNTIAAAPLNTETKNTIDTRNIKIAITALEKNSEGCNIC